MNAASDPNSVAAREPRRATGEEHILLVDDEELVATMWTRLLKSLGYRVSPFTSSIDALAAFRTDAETFDLVITDQVMPILPGLELIAALRNVRADVPVILMTGYSDVITAELVGRMGIQAFLMKPVGAPVLADTIREVLDGRSVEASA